MDKQKLQLSQFNLLSVFGFGNYAKIGLVRKKTSGKLYALKITKKYKKENNIKKYHAYIEKQILTQCKHPFIIKMYGTFQQSNKLYYVLEYCPGGQLFGLIKRSVRISEQRCKFYAGQIFLALEYLHSKKIIYRDLKPENVLLDKKGYIKLIDFGLSAYLKEGNIEKSNLLAGTPEYLPPQIFHKEAKIGFEIDWWCFGSIIFQMMVGFPPFFSSEQKTPQLIEKIKNEPPPLHHIKNPLQRDFIQKILQKNPSQRLGFNGTHEVKNHPWMIGMPWQKFLRKQLKAPFQPELKSDGDTRWFQVESQKQLSPPDEESAKSGDSYQQFSFSWRSSSKSSNEEKNQAQKKNAEPSQITINITEGVDIE